MAYHSKSYSLSDEVIEWLDGLKARFGSYNKGLRILMASVPFGEVRQPEGEYIPKTEATIQKNVTPRRQSKKDRIVAELAASDLTAQQVGREDIEYGLHTELPRGEHIAQLDAVARPAGSTHGKVTVETWRQDRKPIPKPRDRK